MTNAPGVTVPSDAVLKDQHLFELSRGFNVAQFASFSPSLESRFTCMRGYDHADTPDAEGIVGRLLAAADASSVNIRSFAPGREKGNPFVYGLKAVDDVLSVLRARAAEGLFTIVNETIPVEDGGVSGVSLGGVLEFAPEDTPRAVEEPGIASLPFELGRTVLSRVYGVQLELSPQLGERLEWSLHPRRVGFRKSHTLVWEYERVAPVEIAAAYRWPNRFSRHIGDKVFGLVIADALGLHVPETVVISRKVAPFRFGVKTGTGEKWLRTAPLEQAPGKFTTTLGWTDPFELLSNEDPEGRCITSVLAQESVDASYSGATLPRPDADYDFVEGVSGHGDDFMTSARGPENLPSTVIEDVRVVTSQARKKLGPVRIEWAHDGERVWVLQLHVTPDMFAGSTISPGKPSNGWLTFESSQGLDVLRTLIEQARESRRGVVVLGNVGLTSHVGDLLRKAAVPARFDDHND